MTSTKKKKEKFDKESDDMSEDMSLDVDKDSLKRKSRKAAFEGESLDSNFKKPKALKKKVKIVKITPDDVNAGLLSEIKKELIDAVVNENVKPKVTKDVLMICTKYEDLIVSLLAKNMALEKVNNILEKDKMMYMEEAKKNKVVSNNFVGDGVTPVVKPVETWSAVIRSKQGESSEEILNKINTKVGPTLGVRVHDLKKIKSGGAIIRTPSLEECKRVVSNKKFEEVGLTVDFNQQKKPKMKILSVDSSVTKEEMLSGIYSFYSEKFKMGKEEFLKNINIITNWEPEPYRTLTVVIEATEEIISIIKNQGRVYVDYRSFIVRDFNEVMSCFKCHSYDHVIADCHITERICSRCCQSGHNAAKCKNEKSCRVCKSRNLRSDHLMLTTDCPDYAVRLAKIKARH